MNKKSALFLVFKAFKRLIRLDKNVFVVMTAIIDSYDRKEKCGIEKK